MQVLDELAAARVPGSDVAYAFEDLPANDWRELVRAVHGADGVARRAHVSIVPRSFYEACFPSASLHLAFAFIAPHWLSAAPCDVGPRAGARAEWTLRGLLNWFSIRGVRAASSTSRLSS